MLGFVYLFQASESVTRGIITQIARLAMLLIIPMQWSMVVA